MQSWKYFGRTGGGGRVFEICRFPDNGHDLNNQDWTNYPEWLQPDGSWVHYPDDLSIRNERLVGNFDEFIDELTKDKVDELHADWMTHKWPGRTKESVIRDRGTGIRKALLRIYPVMKWLKWYRWIVLFFALATAYVGLYGFRNPFTDVEQLVSPMFVRSVTLTQLILADGRTVSLPWIKELPRDNPLFQEAISNGIEVGSHGEVFCLIWVDPTAPQFPIWKKRRVNLGVLAAVLNPVGLDESQVDPTVIDSFRSDVRWQYLRTYGMRERRLLGFHWSWLTSIPENYHPWSTKNARTP